MTKTLINELVEELWLKENRDMLKIVKIRMNHDIYMLMVADHNSAFNMNLSKDDPRITFQGIPLERTAEVERWEIIL